MNGQAWSLPHKSTRPGVRQRSLPESSGKQDSAFTRSACTPKPVERQLPPGSKACTGKVMLRQLIVLSCISLSITAWSVGAGSASPVSPGLRAQQHTTWQSIGPAPPAITTPIVADAATHTIYIGSAGAGVLKSTNGGATFVAVNNGLGGTLPAFAPAGLTAGTCRTSARPSEPGRGNDEL